MKLNRKQKGISLIESLIAMTIVMFAIISSTKIIMSNIQQESLSNSNSSVEGELKNRVIEFLATGNFDMTEENDTLFTLTNKGKSDDGLTIYIAKAQNQTTKKVSSLEFLK